nr:hypothetical protein [Tanacetum cinerariifolium]
MAGTVSDDGFGTALAPANVLRKHKWGIRMNVDEETVRQLAQLIWETEGKPEGQESRHWEMATRLAESAAMAPVRSLSKHKVDTLFPSPDQADNDPGLQNGRQPHATTDEKDQRDQQPQVLGSRWVQRKDQRGEAQRNAGGEHGGPVGRPAADQVTHCGAQTEHRHHHRDHEGRGVSDFDQRGRQRAGISLGGGRRRQPADQQRRDRGKPGDDGHAPAPANGLTDPGGEGHADDRGNGQPHEHSGDGLGTAVLRHQRGSEEHRDPEVCAMGKAAEEAKKHQPRQRRRDGTQGVGDADEGCQVIEANSVVPMANAPMARAKSSQPMLKSCGVWEVVMGKSGGGSGEKHAVIPETGFRSTLKRRRRAHFKRLGRQSAPGYSFGLASGRAAPLGHSIQICPCCFMLPASSPAASPVPQNMSARTSPAMAPPVSCAATGRTSGEPSGRVEDNHSKLPSGMTLRSIATL